MSKLVLRTVALTLVCSMGGIAIAQTSGADIGLKPGLWEMKVTKQIVDGKDVTAQVNSGIEMLRQSLANMTPEQRQKMSAMMGNLAVGSSGAPSICVSAAMAAKNQPLVGHGANCPPAKITHSGNQTTFELQCTSNGKTTVGTGTSIVNGNVITTSMTATISDAKGQHVMQNESQMTFVGSDCQGIRPIDQPVN